MVHFANVPANVQLGKGVETAEWLNFFVAQIWPVIDPILFQAGLDQVEEIAKKQAPAPIVRRIMAVEFFAILWPSPHQY